MFLSSTASKYLKNICSYSYRNNICSIINDVQFQKYSLMSLFKVDLIIRIFYEIFKPRYDSLTVLIKILHLKTQNFIKKVISRSSNGRTKFNKINA